MTAGRSPAGFRLREQRRKLGLTQVAVAARAGISASYLNLIEHGRRDVAGGVLRRLAEVLGIDVAVLSGVEDARLAHELAEISADPLLQDLHLAQGDAQDIVGRVPAWGRAVVRLHRSYHSASTLAETLANRLSQDAELVQVSHELLTRMTSIRSFAEILSEDDEVSAVQRRRFTRLLAEESGRLGTAAKALFDHLSEIGGEPRPATPAQEVDDFIIDRGNWFPELETIAEAVRSRVTPGGIPGERALAGHLSDLHGIDCALAEEENRAAPAFDFRPEARSFSIPAGTPATTVRFRLARLLFRLEASDIVADLVRDRRLTGEVARGRAAEALYSYGAGALLMPYAPFRAAADDTRHDLDRLATQFGSSFEQVCHRLVTLKRPGEEGIPFAFLRVDPAGNISKRFSLPSLRLPRHGGACPLWIAYRALQTPGTIATQRVRLPDGREFLFVARSTSKPPLGYGIPSETHSVMIACEKHHADRLVYAEGMTTGRTLETGINCHLCPRENCAQRAYPSILAES